MQTLAELSFEYIWLVMFGPEEVIDLDYSARCQESLPLFFARLSDSEKRALIEVAAATRDRLLAPPDKDGYTPRKLVTEDQKAFLSAFIAGEVFREWE